MKLLSLLLFLFSLQLISAQKENPFRAPLNEGFINQTEKSGYIQPPFKIQHRSVALKGAVVLPSSFDLRNVNEVSYVPSVRNQNPYGTCWTFATCASIETSWKMAGDNTFTNLSEGNMVKCSGFDYGYDDGGNEYMSTAYLTRFAGPVYETSDPYSKVTSSCPSIDKESDIPAYIDNVLWIGDDEDLIKYTIMTYGAVATSMYGSFNFFNYNSSDYTYYYDGSQNSDHAVTIVGWDDNKVVTGGRSYTPENKGAWIIRNSWGENYNNSGYFYASYEDKYIGRACELYHGKTSVSEIDTVFDYAKLGLVTAYRVEKGQDYAYAVVKYHAGDDYLLTHVGTALITEGTTVDIALCRSFDGTSLSDTIASINDVVCTYAGYQKIEFPALVPKGDFYLVIKYTTPGYGYPLPAEVAIDGYSSPQIEEGKTWVSADGITWTQAGLNTSYEFDLAVKVIAKYAEDVQPYFTVEKNTASLNQSITFTNQSIGNIDSFVWRFPGDDLMTENTSESVTYSFSSLGEKTVTLVAYVDGVPYTYTKQNAVTVTNEIFPHITIVGADEYYAKESTITLIGSGGDDYYWYADDYLDGETGQVVSIVPTDDVWVKMKAVMGSCSAYDSVLIEIKDVSYDNIEDALSLTINKTTSGISNAYASVEDDEPTPTLKSCSSQTDWCDEGGLQNSIWFKFVAGSTSLDSISTYGFDNQIALYDATATGSYADIMSGDESKYSILAANDDYHSSDNSACITKVTGLTFGKTYWIQMDGSAGGAEGEVSITVYDSKSSAIDVTNEECLDVVNTASLFSVKGEQLDNSTVFIINSLGQVVYTDKITNSNLRLSGDDLSNGFYLINIKNKSLNKVYKVIVSDKWRMSIN